MTQLGWGLKKSSKIKSPKKLYEFKFKFQGNQTKTMYTKTYAVSAKNKQEAINKFKKRFRFNRLPNGTKIRILKRK